MLLTQSLVRKSEWLSVYECAKYCYEVGNGAVDKGLDRNENYCVPAATDTIVLQ